MTETARGRLYSLLSLAAITILMYVPARVAWDRASALPPQDHGLTELADTAAPSGVTWRCLIEAIETAALPGTNTGFAIAVNDGDRVDADLVIERGLGGNLFATIDDASLVVTGLTPTRRVPLECGGFG